MTSLVEQRGRRVRSEPASAARKASTTACGVGSVADGDVVQQPGLERSRLARPSPDDSGGGRSSVGQQCPPLRDLVFGLLDPSGVAGPCAPARAWPRPRPGARASRPGTGSTRRCPGATRRRRRRAPAARPPASGRRVGAWRRAGRARSRRTGLCRSRSALCAAFGSRSRDRLGLGDDLFLLLLVADLLGVALGEGLRAAGEERVLRGAEPGPQRVLDVARRARPAAFHSVIRSRMAAAVSFQSEDVDSSSACAIRRSFCLLGRAALGVELGEVLAPPAAEGVAGGGEPLPQRVVGLAVDALDLAPFLDDRAQPVARRLPRRARLGDRSRPRRPAPPWRRRRRRAPARGRPRPRRPSPRPP